MSPTGNMYLCNSHIMVSALCYHTNSAYFKKTYMYKVEGVTSIADIVYQLLHV